MLSQNLSVDSHATRKNKKNKLLSSSSLVVLLRGIALIKVIKKKSCFDFFHVETRGLVCHQLTEEKKW